MPRIGGFSTTILGINAAELFRAHQIVAVRWAQLETEFRIVGRTRQLPFACADHLKERRAMNVLRRRR